MNKRIIMLLELLCSIVIIASLFQTGFVYTLGGSPIEYPLYMSGAKPILNIAIGITGLLCLVNVIAKLISAIRNSGRGRWLSWSVIAFGVISLLSVLYTKSIYSSWIEENTVTNKMEGYEYGLGAKIAEASDVSLGGGFYILLLSIIALIVLQFVKSKEDTAEVDAEE